MSLPVGEAWFTQRLAPNAHLCRQGCQGLYGLTCSGPLSLLVLSCACPISCLSVSSFWLLLAIDTLLWWTPGDTNDRKWRSNGWSGAVQAFQSRQQGTFSNQMSRSSFLPKIRWRFLLFCKIVEQLSSPMRVTFSFLPFKPNWKIYLKGEHWNVPVPWPPLVCLSLSAAWTSPHEPTAIPNHAVSHHYQPIMQ